MGHVLGSAMFAIGCCSIALFVVTGAWVWFEVIMELIKDMRRH